MTTYAGFEVLDVVTPDRGAGGTTHDFLRPLEVLSNPIGRSAFRPPFDGVKQGYSFRWICQGRTAKVELRSWVDTHFGRRIPFWVPSYRRDMVLHEGVGSGAVTMRIEPIRYALQVFSQGRQRRHITLYPPATTPAVFHEIEAAAPGSEFEELTVTSAFGQDWPVSTVISYLMLVRLASDEVTLLHKGPEFAIADIPVVELHQEVP